METAAMITETVFIFCVLVLFYTYVLYPLVAFLIGSKSAKKVPGPLKSISVLVPAHNEGTVIGEKIRNFQELDYPNELIELLILDDGSNDETAEIVSSMQNDRVRLIRSPERKGKAAAMNRLVESSEREILMFSDANVMFHSRAVKELVAHLGDEQVGAVTGEVRLLGSNDEFSFGEEVYYWIERRIQSAESRIGSVMGVDGGMYALRRHLWAPLPADTILDDFAVSLSVMRSHHRVIYEGDAKATETGTPTARQEFSRRARIAAGTVQLLRRRIVPRLTQPILWMQFLSHKVLRWVSPIILCITLATNCVIVLQDQSFLPFLYAQFAFYGLLTLSVLLRRLRKNPIGATLFYFGLSQVAMGVGLCRGMLDRQRPQWEKWTRLSADEQARIKQRNPSG